MDSCCQQAICALVARMESARVTRDDIYAVCERAGLDIAQTKLVRLWLECALDWRIFNDAYESPLSVRLGRRRANRFGWPAVSCQKRNAREARASAEAALPAKPAPNARGKTERARRAVVRQAAKACEWFIDDRKGLLCGPNGSTKAPGMAEIDKSFVVVGWDSRHLRTLLRPRRSA